MYHVSAQGVDERMINVHCYYYVVAPRADEPVGPWSPWSDCDNDCGLGKTTRTRQNLGNANPDIYPLEQESVCYTTCMGGKFKTQPLL